MRTDRAGHPEAGFTLVEVLIALLVLSIGLLGLEALGIGAARSLALADRQSGSATIAADSLESAMHQLRNGALPLQFCRDDLPYGDRLSRRVDLSNPQLPTVTVLTLPAASTQMAATDTFSISSSLYLPVAFAGGVAGAPCS